MGTVPINLPLVRTAELQLSMSFSNLAVPAIGGMAAQIRFLQKQGVDLAVRGRVRRAPDAEAERGDEIEEGRPYDRLPGESTRVETTVAIELAAS